MNEDQRTRFAWLWRFYREEAERCCAAQAWFGACVLLGARLEATLLGMVDAYEEELELSSTARRRRNAGLSILVWSFADLLNIAKELRWLTPKECTRCKRDIKGMRNFVHAGNYAISPYGGDIGEKELKERSVLLEHVIERLNAKFEDSLARREQLA